MASVTQSFDAVVIGAGYPKGAEHYSLSAPPFGFEIRYAPEDNRFARVRGGI